MEDRNPIFCLENHETALFQSGDAVPNHPDLPLVVYRNVLSEASPDPAGAFESAYREHQWGGTWRNGIFPYHHYHSTAHEVLAVARGTALVQFGGPQGKKFRIGHGDVAILPAGTGHKRLDASNDLLVVGGYPAGQNADLVRATTTPSGEIIESIRSVPLPDTDPIGGREGALVREWGITE